MNLNEKILESKRIISTLHFLGVNINHQTVKEFVNIFVGTYINQGAYTSTKYKELKTSRVNNVLLFDENNKPGVELIETYKRFSENGDLDPVAYFENIEKIRDLVLKMFAHDLRRSFKVKDYSSSDDAIIKRMISYDSTNPFKFSQVRTKVHAKSQFLNDYYELIDIIHDSNSYYNLADDSCEVTIQFSLSTLDLINNHLSSKHHMPSYSVENANAVRNAISGLTANNIPPSIFIIPENCSKVIINGKEYHKLNDNDDVFNRLDQVYIVVDNYCVLNDHRINRHRIHTVTTDGKMKVYNKVAGKFYPSGYIDVV